MKKREMKYPLETPSENLIANWKTDEEELEYPVNIWRGSTDGLSEKTGRLFETLENAGAYSRIDFADTIDWGRWKLARRKFLVHLKTLEKTEEENHEPTH